MAGGKFKVLSLFAGIGGFDLGLERTGGFETVAFCEIDPFARRVLVKHWPEVPCYHDVRELTGEQVGSVDVICGGFPCQDISTAGRGAGIDGERSGLWREYFRIVREVRPRYVVVENSAALLFRGLDRVLGDLASVGYHAFWDCIPASYLGAPHIRDRAYIVAHADTDSKPACALNDEARGLPTNGVSLNAECRIAEIALQLARAGRQRQPVSWDRVWPDENPPLGMGVDDGLPERLDRLRALGNAVVPQIPELIGRAILAAEQSNATHTFGRSAVSARAHLGPVSPHTPCTGPFSIHTPVHGPGFYASSGAE